MSNASTIASHLKGKQTTDGWFICKCPLHDDKHASLGVKDGENESVVFHCHAGCESKDIADYFHKNGFHVHKNKDPAKKTEICRYPYTDMDGILLFEKIRYMPKSFSIVDEHGKPGMNGHAGTLYNITALRDCKDKIVIVTEGEKDCDTLTKLGFLAVTSGGATSWPVKDNKFFSGANVVICPDNDDAGKKYRDTVEKNLTGIAQSIHTISVPQMYKDISDWNPNKDEIQYLIDNQLKSFLWLNGDELGNSAKAPVFIINNILEEDSHGILAGPSMAFKTFIVLRMVYSICTGTNFFGHEVFSSGKVLYICGEGKGALSRRIKALQIVEGDFNGNLLVMNETIRIDNKDDMRKLKKDIDFIKPAFVVFDTFASLVSEVDENKPSEVASTLRLIKETCRNGTACSMIIHHHGKDVSKGMRGASNFVNDVDFALETERDKDERMQAILRCKKMKDGDHFNDIALQAEKVDLGLVRQDGNTTTSLILDIGAFESSGLDKTTAEILLSFQTFFSLHAQKPHIDLPENVQLAVYIDDFRPIAYPLLKVAAQSKRTAFKRAIDKLIDCKKINYYNNYIWL